MYSPGFDTIPVGWKLSFVLFDSSIFSVGSGLFGFIFICKIFGLSGLLTFESSLGFVSAAISSLVQTWGSLVGQVGRSRQVWAICRQFGPVGLVRNAACH